MLSAPTGQEIYLKLENLQMTGSFKERGALNRIAQLTPEQAARGVVAASAGNHAQVVAYQAMKRGIRAVIVMPLTTPLVKVTATRGFGAEVILQGTGYDDAFTEAMRIREEQDLTFIHSFDDAAVIAGAGTIGPELLEQVPDLEAVVAPIGGGGLIGGIGCAIKALKPEVRIVGVQTARIPSMAAAVAAHHPVTLPPATTIADGIAVRRAGDLTLPLVERYVDELVTVDEDEIASAILMLLEKEKTVAEGAGATALAALLQRRTSLQGARTAVLVCGGNIDRDAAVQNHRARLGAGRQADPAAHPSAGPARRAARRDAADGRPAGEHCGRGTQSRVLRRPPGRHGDRHYAGDARTRPCGADSCCADGGGLPAYAGGLAGLSLCCVCLSGVKPSCW